MPAASPGSAAFDTDVAAGPAEYRHRRWCLERHVGGDRGTATTPGQCDKTSNQEPFHDDTPLKILRAMNVQYPRTHRIAVTAKPQLKTVINGCPKRLEK